MSKKNIIIHLNDPELEKRESYKKACKILEEYNPNHPTDTRMKLINLESSYVHSDCDLSDAKIVCEVLDKYTSNYPQSSIAEKTGILLFNTKYYSSELVQGIKKIYRKINENTSDDIQYLMKYWPAVAIPTLILLGYLQGAYLLEKNKEYFENIELPQETTCVELSESKVDEETINSVYDSGCNLSNIVIVKKLVKKLN